jgi:hypothetical protein
MRKAARTDSATLPVPRKLIRKRGHMRPSGKKERSGCTRSSAAVNSHRCDPQIYDPATPPETHTTPTSTTTSDSRQQPMAHSACLTDRGQEKGSAVTGRGCDDLASVTEMFNGFRVSELAADMQRAIRGGQEAGSHGTGERQHAEGEEHQQEAPKDHQHQQQQPCRGGNLQKDSDVDDDSSQQGSEQGSDLSSDHDSYGDSSSDSRQCCADLQMMRQIPKTPSEMIAQRRMNSECSEEGVVRYHGLWFCWKHAPRPARSILNQGGGWECSSAEPPCEQPGLTLHGGIWFCREHAMIQEEEAYPPAESSTEAIASIMQEGIYCSTRSVRASVMAVSFLIWWWEAHWGWTAATWIWTTATMLRSAMGARRKAQQQQQQH